MGEGVIEKFMECISETSYYIIRQKLVSDRITRDDFLAHTF